MIAIWNIEINLFSAFKLFLVLPKGIFAQLFHWNLLYLIYVFISALTFPGWIIDVELLIFLLGQNTYLYLEYWILVFLKIVVSFEDLSSPMHISLNSPLYADVLLILVFMLLNFRIFINGVRAFS